MTLRYAAGTAQKCKTANNAIVMANSEANNIAPPSGAGPKRGHSASIFRDLSMSLAKPPVCDFDHTTRWLLEL